MGMCNEFLERGNILLLPSGSLNQLLCSQHVRSSLAFYPSLFISVPYTHGIADRLLTLTSINSETLHSSWITQ